MELNRISVKWLESPLGGKLPCFYEMSTDQNLFLLYIVTIYPLGFNVVLYFYFFRCRWSYSQRAIVATVKVDASKFPNQVFDDSPSIIFIHCIFLISYRIILHLCMAKTAWQKYLPTGPLALLPLWDGYSSIVWTTSVAESARLVKLSKEEFLSELR